MRDFMREPSHPISAALNGKRYVFVFIALFVLVLSAILSLNLLLGERGLGSPEATRQASAWQAQTQGVTYAPPITHTRPFKILRLADRLQGVNTLVLGSSTVMGITAEMFPPTHQLYNFSLAGNVTAAVVAEAAYVERHYSERIRWMIVGLDWSLGLLYQPLALPAVDLSAAGEAQSPARRDAPWFKRLEDALTWPKVRNLGLMLKAVAKSDAPLAEFRHLFSDIASAPYRCTDGATARDFDVINRGLCRGYRYDGSWTFANDSRLSSAQAKMLAMAATAASSKYTQQLCTGGGAPHAAYLQSLGDTARRFSERGGRMVFLLPPLAPGMEQAFAQHARWGKCLEHTKAVLQQWAVQHGVIVVDAGASERYGCSAGEFVDEHHAYPECNARLLKRFFADFEHGRLAPGLYRPSAP